MMGGWGGWSYVVAKVGVDLPGSLLPGRWYTFAGGKSGRRRRRRENLSTLSTVLMSFIDIFHRNKQPKHENFAPAARYDYHSAFWMYNYGHLWKLRMICREVNDFFPGRSPKVLGSAGAHTVYRRPKRAWKGNKAASF